MFYSTLKHTSPTLEISIVIYYQVTAHACTDIMTSKRTRVELIIVQGDLLDPLESSVRIRVRLSRIENFTSMP